MDNNTEFLKNCTEELKMHVELKRAIHPDLHGKHQKEFLEPYPSKNKIVTKDAQR